MSLPWTTNYLDENLSMQHGASFKCILFKCFKAMPIYRRSSNSNELSFYISRKKKKKNQKTGTSLFLLNQSFSKLALQSIQDIPFLFKK